MTTLLKYDAACRALGISAREKSVLEVLFNHYGCDCNCLTFAGIASLAEIDRKNVRRTVRSLARKGLAEYVRGLFDEDGQVCGSGYCCTRLGKEFFETIDGVAA